MRAVLSSKVFVPYARKRYDLGLIAVLLRLIIVALLRYLVFHADRLRTRAVAKLRKPITFSFDHEQLKALPTYKLPDLSQVVEDPTITLATKEVPLNAGVFNGSYEDIEDYYSVHRFYWIFPLLSKSTSARALSAIKRMILDWIEQNPKAAKSPQFEPYTISERCISWLTFLCYAKDSGLFSDDDYKKITGSIEVQMVYLANNIEYKGLATNNHILNNARALYFCGIAFNSKLPTAAADKIFKKHIPLMIREGELTEGSSHYQMLLTMKFLELHKFVSLKGGLQLADTLGVPLAEMLRVCRLIHGKRSYPLIGDVSPDVTPAWLNGWPFSDDINAISPWHRIFDHSVMLGPGRSRNIVKLSSPRNSFELWVSAKDNGPGCHGHNDNGSFMLYYKGAPVVIDPGLSSYIENDLNLRQTSQHLHSVPCIGYALWDIEKHYKTSYMAMSSNARLIGCDDGVDVELLSFDKQVRLERTFRLNDASIDIRDKVTKDRYGTVGYSCLLPLDPGILPVLTHGKAELKPTGVSIVTSLDMTIEDIVVCGRYGERKASKAVKLASMKRGEIPFSIEITNE